MNDKFHKHITKAGEDVSLSQEERARMRSVLQAYMAMKPLRTSETVAAPTFGWLFTMRPVAAVLVFALFISSAGVSYAAEDALPGDVLYSIKTHVNEPVKGALAVSASAKADWAMDVAATRLEEAATLAAAGQLDTQTQASLKENFDEHANTAIALINEQATTSPNAGANAAVSFEAQLSEYERVLTQVGDSKGISINALASAVHAKHNDATFARVNAEANANATNTSSSSEKTAASSMRDLARAQLKASLGLARSADGSIDASSAAQVNNELDRADVAIQSGEAQLDGNSTDARATFAKVLSATEKVGVFLKTSAAIHARTGLKIADTNKGKAVTPAAKTVRAQNTAPAAPAIQTMSATLAATTTVEATTTLENDMIDVHVESPGYGSATNDNDDNKGSDESKTLPLTVPTTFFH